MKEQLQGKCILVSDFEVTPLLFKCKANYPDATWKVLKKDELLDRLSFSFAKDPVPYLLSQGIDYTNAKKYLRLLRVAAIDKHPKLQSLYDDLSAKGYFKEDDLGKLEVSRYPVLLLEMEEDEELHAFLKRKGVAYSDVTLEDLGAKPYLAEGQAPTVYSFPNKFAQYFYIYSDIRKKLLEDPSMKERITVLIHDESDLYYVNIFAKLFGIPSYATFLRPFISRPVIKKKTTSIYAAKSFAFTPEEEADEELSELKGIVDYYGLASLPFDFAYASLLEIANTLGVKERIDDRGTAIENRFVLNPDEKIYVTDFQYDVFYKVYDDKNVLTDAEMVQVEANPSYVLTKLDRRKKLNYLTYNDIALLSRVRQHLTDKIYDSPFIEELKWGKSSIRKVEMNEAGVYTSEAGRLYLANQLDKQFYPGSFGDYKSYDHSFGGLSKPVFKPNKNWSITDLESYIRCPFKYYLSKVLPDPDLGNHVMWLGTLIHKVMERVLSDAFDFEAEFALGVKEYQSSVERAKKTYGPKEELWLDIAEYWLKEFVVSIRKAKLAMHLVQETPEQKITFQLQGSKGETYTFANAKIDKVIVTEEAGQKFYTIIDYKSGIEEFDAERVFLGLSSQLPLYYYAIENSPIVPSLTLNGIFGGFGIIHNFASSPSKIYADAGVLKRSNISGKTANRGLFRVSSTYLRSIDSTAFKKDGDLKAYGGDYVKRKYGFTDENGKEDIVPNEIPGGYNFATLIEEAKQGLVQTIEAILRNDFPIAPTTTDLEAGEFGTLACAGCPYADICYRYAAKDKKSYEGIIHAHFHGAPLTPEEDDEEEEDE